jgi:hypothetical protein
VEEEFSEVRFQGCAYLRSVRTKSLRFLRPGTGDQESDPELQSKQHTLVEEAEEPCQPTHNDYGDGRDDQRC